MSSARGKKNWAKAELEHARVEAEEWLKMIDRVAGEGVAGEVIFV